MISTFFLLCLSHANAQNVESNFPTAGTGEMPRTVQFHFHDAGKPDRCPQSGCPGTCQRPSSRWWSTQRASRAVHPPKDWSKTAPGAWLPSTERSRWRAACQNHQSINHIQRERRLRGGGLDDSQGPTTSQGPALLRLQRGGNCGALRRAADKHTAALPGGGVSPSPKTEPWAAGRPGEP